MKFQKKHLGLLTATLVAAAPAYPNDERASLETLRQTTLNLIEALVESGVLPRDKANGLIKKAEQDAAKTVAQKAPSTTVRVPYVPEIVKAEIREQIKQEVLAQAKTERWAEPNAIPSWLDSIKWEGDLRLRYQVDDFPSDNTMPFPYALADGTLFVPPTQGTTRAAGFSAVDGNGVLKANTTERRERSRVRARIGLLAKASETWSGGIRLTTGAETDRVSTNQTLGQDWNKYDVYIDRAFVKYDPVEWLSITGGRIPNPWFSTDLVWDEDLNFEGVAATFKPVFDNGAIKPFLTVGAFPIKEDNPPLSDSRWMHAIQAGAQWDFSSSSRFKFGLAWYRFKDFEGRMESNSSLLDVGGGNYVINSADYGQYEYSSNLRQKGNTLFRTNALLDTSSTLWGLASEFRPVSLTASLDLAHFDPVHVVMTGDWVKNAAYDRNEIRSRSGATLIDGDDKGYQYKLTVGMPRLKEARDWQASLSYRYLGSDAVVDAFTDSDFGGGGTNLKGYTIGLQYAVDRNAVIGLRWLSADQIDSFAPGTNFKYSQDVMQADINVRF